jgi:hypothetical protein
MIKVSLDKLSLFHGIKLIYTIFNVLSLGNWEMKLPGDWLNVVHIGCV